MLAAEFSVPKAWSNTPETPPPHGCRLYPLWEVQVRRIGQLVVMIGCVISSPTALAQATAPATNPAVVPQAAPADDPNEVICRPGEPQLGSRFPGPRQCHTRREWDQIKRDSQEALFHQQMQRSCNAGTTC
jgi:hypothetical protein